MPARKKTTKQTYPALGKAINLRLKVQPVIEIDGDFSRVSLDVTFNGNGQPFTIPGIGFGMVGKDRKLQQARIGEGRYRRDYIATHIEQVLLETLYSLFNEAASSGEPYEKLKESMGSAYALIDNSPFKKGRGLGWLESIVATKAQHMHTRLMGFQTQWFHSKPKRLFAPFEFIMYQAYYPIELKRWQKAVKVYRQAVEFDHDWRYEVEMRCKIQPYEKDLLECLPNHKASEIAMVCAARHTGAGVDISHIGAIKRAVRDEKRWLKETTSTGRTWPDANKAAGTISDKK